MPLFGSPSPLLISTPSSPTAASGSAHHPHHHHHHPHHHRPLNQFRSTPTATASGGVGSFSSPASAAASSSSYFNNLSPSHHPSSAANAASLSAAAGGIPSSSSGKRSRDDDDDDDDAHMSGLRDGSSTPPASHLRPAASGSMRSNAPSGRPMVHKKLRSFAGQQAQEGNGAGSNNADSAAPSIDLGKMLASLDRPELLSLIMRLLSTSTDPTLPAQVQALLPAPSLESINTTLNVLEGAIQQAMPLAGARPEYVWGRVRGPLNEFATTAVGFAETLLQRRSAQAASASSSSSSSSPFGAATTELDPDGHVHATTAFAFLLDLTARVLRIERSLPPPPKSVFFTSSSGPESSAQGAGSNNRAAAAAAKRSANVAQQASSFAVFKNTLGEKESSAATTPGAAPVSFFGGFAQPSSSSSAFSTLTGGADADRPSAADALVTILLPTLLSQWDTLLRRLSSAVNQQGRMFGQEVVLSWYRSLISLGSEAAASASQSGSGTPVLSRPSVFGGASAAFPPARPSFGFGFGAPSAPTSSSGFGFGAASTSSNSSFGFGSMSMPSSSSASSSAANDSSASPADNLRAEEEALRAAMDWIRDVFEREIGWLVGLDKMRAAAGSA
ncbi:hypothetical protein OC844_002826 [Tilletia horrida]|nr:hypothetical protein OC844_002826 [Tilletia horrida]